MPRKQSLAHRLERLEQRSCPVHGMGMDQIDGWYYPDNDEPFTIVGCSRRDCLISAKEFSIDKPLELLPEYLYVLDPDVIAEALAAPPQKSVSPKTPKVSKESIFSKTGGKCYYCGCLLDPETNFTTDHIIPRISGGSNRTENLVPCCRACNSTKGKRTIEEFRFSRTMQHFKEKTGISFTKAQIVYLNSINVELDLPRYIFWFEHQSVSP